MNKNKTIKKINKGNKNIYNDIYLSEMLNSHKYDGISGSSTINYQNPVFSPSDYPKFEVAPLEFDSSAIQKVPVKGGGLNMDAVNGAIEKGSAVLSGVSGVAEAFTSNSKIADTSGIEGSAQSNYSKNFDAADNDALMSQWQTFTPMQHIHWRDIRGSNLGQQLVNTGKGVTTGATAGATVGGPVGAIVGGVAGLFSGIGGIFSGNAKARRKARRINRTIDQANAMAELAFRNEADDISMLKDLNYQANYVAYGGPINIKKSNRGKFTESANRAGMGVQEYARHILANKEDYSPLQVKRANFARNASKWKHGYGGNLFAFGGDFDNGVTYVGNGGSHEENMFEGVPMGIAPDGQPNLVEEGEVIYDNYVFSNRLNLDEDSLSTYSLPKEYLNMPFSKIAEKIESESKERPNDPISKKGLEDSMNKLKQAQEGIKAKKNKINNNRFDYGGPYLNIEPYDYRSPFIGFDGTPYVDFNRVVVPTNNVNVSTKRANSTPVVKKNYAGIMDSISDADLSLKLNRELPPLAFEDIRRRESSNSGVAGSEDENYRQEGMGIKGLRYAPVIGSGLATLSDIAGITNKSDYKNYDLIKSAVDNLSHIESTPISNYLEYNPFDRNFYLNKNAAQAAATRRAIIDQSGGNRANAVAGILASDYNAQEALGDLARKAEEYNLNQRLQVEGFNRDTNKFNSDLALRTAAANMGQDRVRLQGLQAAAQMRAAEDAQNAAARSANVSNFLNNLGGLGEDIQNRESLDMLIKSGYFGTLPENESSNKKRKRRSKSKNNKE